MEIKTTLNHSSYNVEIHGINQLLPQRAFSLNILFLRMIEVVDGEFSIDSLVEKIGISNIPLATRIEINNLSSDLKAAQFNCMESLVFHVDKDFPKITSRNISSIQGSEHIKDVSYILDLDGLVSITFDKFLAEMK